MAALAGGGAGRGGYGFLAFTCCFGAGGLSGGSGVVGIGVVVVAGGGWVEGGGCSGSFRGDG